MPPSLSAPLAGEPVASAPPVSAEPMSTTAHATTSPFGWRRDPFTGATTYHRGVDLRAAYGEPIGAAGNGRVVFAGEQGGYGQTVVVGGVSARTSRGIRRSVMAFSGMGVVEVIDHRGGRR